jgi:hypothetical protein
MQLLPKSKKKQIGNWLSNCSNSSRWRSKKTGRKKRKRKKKVLIMVMQMQI